MKNCKGVGTLISLIIQVKGTNVIRVTAVLEGRIIILFASSRREISVLSSKTKT